ncbi:hypothetical protein [Desulfovibrio sp.]|uniref:hypothetical protein n=1 Tax=Desulfovibrio sp. TaxID=885 RepID=UPI0025C6EA50|nr:hypothetical protein [Desulfovibrio sp.]
MLRNPGNAGQVKGDSPITQRKNIELTPEEQAELAEKLPALLEVIAKGSRLSGPCYCRVLF